MLKSSPSAPFSRQIVLGSTIFGLEDLEEPAKQCHPAFSLNRKSQRGLWKVFQKYEWQDYNFIIQFLVKGIH